MTDSFIPADLAIAPNPPSLTPNLKLVMVPVDAHTSFEFWVPLDGALLMPEEAMLLKNDRLRLEEICEKLTWLFGATLLSDRKVCSQLIYDWRGLVKLIRQSRQHFDAITIQYSPLTIASNVAENGKMQSWTAQPCTWRICFVELVAHEKNYQLMESSVHVLIAYGQQVTRSAEVATVGI